MRATATDLVVYDAGPDGPEAVLHASGKVLADAGMEVTEVAEITGFLDGVFGA